MATTNLFSDINSLVGLNGKGVTVHNDDAVANAVLNIVLVQRRSRKFRTNYGSYSHYFLQLPVNVDNAEKYRVSLYTDLKAWAGQIASFDLSGINVFPLKNNDGYGVVILYKSTLSGYYNQVSVQLPSTAISRNG